MAALVYPFTTGFLLGGSLIIAIGAQNAFLLRQGLLRQHVFILCLICASIDAAMIILGVAGVGGFLARSPYLIASIRLGGAIFLLWYAFVAFKRALKPQALEATKDAASDLKTAITTCLAFTLLNPHMYLDTVLLVGGLSASFEGNGRIAYAAGAVIASFVWFFGLGYGARLLQPVFEKPRSWQMLDFCIAVVMVAIAVSLVLPFFAS